MVPLLLVEVQSTLNSLSGLVQAWNSWFCHPVVTVLQVQGALLLALLGLGWVLAGLMRLRELEGRQTARAAAAVRNATQKQAWPGVTVILPLKGCRKHSLRNWESQLAQEYNGALEFLFVLDSKDDPAFHTASMLASRPNSNSVRVLIATASRTNSQKIHNIQTGIKAACKEHEFVLCVDDDVCLHPTTLRDTIAALREHPDVFMATGYPFDIPNAGSNLLTYCVLSYHLPLLIAFSMRQRTQFVWGGFMLFPLAAMLDDRHGIMKAWSNGGYSDDLIVAAKCGENSLSILCPSFTVFPQWLDGDYDWSRYWNYLRRQVYVMDTYNGPLNRRINHSMMLIHSYLSLAFVLPAVTVVSRLVLWLLATILLPTQKVYVGPGTSMHWVGAFAADVCPWSSISLAAFLASLAFAASALCWMSGILLRLFQILSPRAELVKVGSFHWGKLWLGFFVNNCLIPVCMLYTRLTSRVVWSGVEYCRRGGKVVQVRRCRDAGSQWRSPRKSIDHAVA